MVQVKTNNLCFKIFFTYIINLLGLPILMFMTMIAFTIYFNIDKLLLLRYYAKPPKMGDAVMVVSKYYHNFELNKKLNN